MPQSMEEQNEDDDFLDSIGAVLITIATMVVSVAEAILLINNESIAWQDRCRLPSQNETSPHSRKRRRVHERRRVHSDAWQQVWLFMLNLRSYYMRKREIECSWYIKPRSIQWFYFFIDWVPYEDPERFAEFFRVTPTTFYAICDMVQDDMITNPPSAFCTLPNRKLSVERQVAIAIRRLSTGDQFLGIGELFGVSHSTVIKVTWKFIQAVNNRGKALIRWPTGAALDAIKMEFSARWGFPNCCGAVDGTHFPVELPAAERSQDYYDYKRKISVSMQAIVDLKLRFLHVVAGWPGSIQDSRLLRVSSFFRDVEYNRTKLNGMEYFCADDVSMLREYILGDAGYPLYPWLIVPYTQGVLDDHDWWNHRHSQTRMAVERAFGQLKGTWRILSRILWKPRKERIGPMIYACCILHNFLIDRGERFNADLLRGITVHPRGYSGVNVPSRELTEGGLEARDNLLNEVWTSDRRRGVTGSDLNHEA